MPGDQLTSKPVLDVAKGTGKFDVEDYLYFGLSGPVDAGAFTDLTG